MLIKRMLFGSIKILWLCVDQADDYTSWRGVSATLPFLLAHADAAAAIRVYRRRLCRGGGGRAGAADGVAPGLAPSILFISYFLLRFVINARYPAAKGVWYALTPFILVVLGALVSSFLMPRFFEGEISVWPEASGFSVLTPLSPDAGNYTQNMYLLINAGLTISAALYLTTLGVNMKRVFNAYLYAGLMGGLHFALAVCRQQRRYLVSHLVFLSNPGWALLSKESIGSVIRITGPFSEPSALASYLCGTVGACGWLLFNGDRALLTPAYLRP